MSSAEESQELSEAPHSFLEGKGQMAVKKKISALIWGGQMFSIVLSSVCFQMLREHSFAEQNLSSTLQHSV